MIVLTSSFDICFDSLHLDTYWRMMMRMNLIHHWMWIYLYWRMVYSLFFNLWCDAVLFQSKTKFFDHKMCRVKVIFSKVFPGYSSALKVHAVEQIRESISTGPFSSDNKLISF